MPARLRTIVPVLLLLAGLAPRLLSLTTPARVAASISEDGYLMLTVARNLADGRGLSTAAGTIPTNGVQPLVTFAWAGVHAVTTSDEAALRVVVVLELLTALAGAWLVGALARHWFASHPDSTAVGWWAGAAWFASPVALRHTTNGLETGFYAVTIASVVLLDARWRARRSFAVSLLIGMLLGVAVLVRNDAALLVAAWCLVRLFAPGHAGPGVADAEPETFARRLAHANVAGLASVAVASPWLAFNLTRVGSIVPISGRSQSLDTMFGENLSKVPRVLAEYALGGLPLPDTAQRGAWPGVIAVVLVATLAMAWARRERLGVRIDRSLVVLALFVAGLATYYGCFFAAGHFLSRYLFPLALVMLPLVAAALVRMAQAASPLALAGVAGWLAAACMADARFAERANRHPHMHVVEWVRANVPAGDWVAAPQSGTVGYFHDRTVNLDGKVNPEALRARDEGRLFRYVADDTEARVIVDWFGLARWMDDPASVKDERDSGVLAARFRYRVRDAGANLVVLERIPHTTGRN